MTLGGEGVKGHDVISYNLWAGKTLHVAILIDSQAEQTTLFGDILQQAEAIYKEPQNNYEDLLSCITNVPWRQERRRWNEQTKNFEAYSGMHRY